MRTFTTLALTLAALLASGAAMAGEPPAAVPEPLSLSLLAGGIVAIAAVRGLRRK